jgi:hypothetical protein
VAQHDHAGSNVHDGDVARGHRAPLGGDGWHVESPVVLGAQLCYCPASGECLWRDAQSGVVRFGRLIEMSGWLVGWLTPYRLE